MSLPNIYIHRVEWCPANWYMNQRNRDYAASFATVNDHGNDAAALSHDEMVNCLRGAEAVLVLNGSHADEITAAALKEAGTIKVIAITHWFSPELIGACTEAGVELIDVTWPCSQAVAEWSLGSIINGLRKTDYFDREMKKGQWPAWSGTAGQLNGSTVGLVATGRIGTCLLKYLAPFDVEVLVFDPYLTPERERELGVKSVDLQTVMCSCDVIALHAPNTPETKNMIGKEQLAAMKDGALLVNGARSFLIDSDAFRDEIKSGRIRAALDVFDSEPLGPEEKYLCALDNVILTPHIAGTTDVMFERCAYFAMEAIKNKIT